MSVSLATGNLSAAGAGSGTWLSQRLVGTVASEFPGMGLWSEST